MSDDPSSRTHEPSLRELTAELDGLREVFTAKMDHAIAVMNERDIRYEQRFKAMDEKTTLALAASDRAVSKAEVATEKRFDAVNEFRQALSDQARLLIPREEVVARFVAFDKDIQMLKESRSENLGKSATWLIVLAIVLSLLSLIARFFGK